jgi:hypothetical protein
LRRTLSTAGLLGTAASSISGLVTGLARFVVVGGIAVTGSRGSSLPRKRDLSRRATRNTNGDASIPILVNVIGSDLEGPNTLSLYRLRVLVTGLHWGPCHGGCHRRHTNSRKRAWLAVFKHFILLFNLADSEIAISRLRIDNNPRQRDSGSRNVNREGLLGSRCNSQDTLPVGWRSLAEEIIKFGLPRDSIRSGGGRGGSLSWWSCCHGRERRRSRGCGSGSGSSDGSSSSSCSLRGQLYNRLGRLRGGQVDKGAFRVSKVNWVARHFLRGRGRRAALLLSNLALLLVGSVREKARAASRRGTCIGLSSDKAIRRSIKLGQRV